MSRRDQQLQKKIEQKLVETTSIIYNASIAEVLFEAGIKKR